MANHDIRHPGETDAYRTKRDELLEAEMELRAKIEAVAALALGLVAGQTLTRGEGRAPPTLRHLTYSRRTQGRARGLGVALRGNQGRSGAAAGGLKRGAAVPGSARRCW